MNDKDILKTILDKLESSERITRSEYLNQKEACTYLGVTKTQLYRLMYERQITYSKPSGKIAYFKKEDLDEYMTRNRVPSLASIEAMASDHTIKEV